MPRKLGALQAGTLHLNGMSPEQIG